MGYPMDKIISAVGSVFPFVDSETKLLFLFVAPFNLVKGFLVMAITYLLYKPLSPILKGQFGRRH